MLLQVTTITDSRLLPKSYTTGTMSFRSLPHTVKLCTSNYLERNSISVGHVVAIQAVQIAMDRKDRERELVSAVLSSLYPQAISADQMARGFTRLLKFTEVGYTTFF